MSQNIARVGFGILILNDKNEVLLGKRHNDPEKADSELHGEGTWTCPGGKLDFGETFAEGTRREAKEETNLEIENLKFISLANERVPDAQFITAGFLCKKYKGEAKVMEPDEIVEWKWFSLDNLPKPMYDPSRKLINNYRDKIVFRE